MAEKKAADDAALVQVLKDLKNREKLRGIPFPPQTFEGLARFTEHVNVPHDADMVLMIGGHKAGKTGRMKLVLEKLREAAGPDEKLIVVDVDDYRELRPTLVKRILEGGQLSYPMGSKVAGVEACGHCLNQADRFPYCQDSSHDWDTSGPDGSPYCNTCRCLAGFEDERHIVTETER